MDNALSVFEKYIGKNIPQTSEVSANITDINQAIGMLQSIDKCLKNCLQELHSREQIYQLIQNCSFMEKKLFDQTVFIASIQKTFYIQDFSTLQELNLENLIQEKRSEISKLLNEIFDFLDFEENSQTLSGQKDTSYSLSIF